MQCVNNVTNETHLMISPNTFISKYISKTRNLVDEHILGIKKNGSYVSEISFHMFHGLKDRSKSEQLLSQLVEFNNSNPNSKIYYDFDIRLFNEMVSFIGEEKIKKIKYLGDGFELYDKELKKKDLQCVNIDDSSEPARRSDWIVAFDYGNKYPKNMEDKILKRLDKNSRFGVILSWNDQSYGNRATINPRPNSYIKRKMAKLGFTNDIEVENRFRNRCDIGPHKQSIMVFRKIQFNVCDNYITDKYPHSAVLSDHHIKNCKMVTDRYSLIDKLGLNKDSKICEVGVFNGDYSKEIIRRINPTELFLVDMNETPQLTNVIKENKCIKFFKGDSLSIMERFEDEKFDYIYIDADHTYNWAFNELNMAKKKLKKGGIIGCNDYIFYDHYANMKYGIVEAVNEFCIKNDFEIIYFALHVQMFCDVILRKIE